MTLPTDFQFSQGSLQDYVDCPRRFQLRYVHRLAWPAAESEPALENERHLQRGAAFHRLVHQHTLGIAPEQLSKTVTNEILHRWWHSYLAGPPADLPPSRYPEIILSGPVSDHRLGARYDLIAIDAGRRAVIVDWKTSRKRPRRKWLAERLQTRVYPYLLVRAGSHLNAGQPFKAEQVEMVYWFANFPTDPERFTYRADQYDADGAYLASLIEEIKEKVKCRGDENFFLTSQKQRCHYCAYRSLCQRGARAGPLEQAKDEWELDDNFDLSLDWGQIAEIEY